MNVVRVGGVWATALSLVFALSGVAHAQDVTVPANGGVVLGEVDRCNANGTESPAAGVTVGTQEASGVQVKTDTNGQFALDVAAGTYTVVASADDGTSAIRPYVPVDTGIAIDIGILDLGMGAGDCGTGGTSGAPAIAVATATPEATVAPTPLPPTATPVPPTPVPNTDQSTPPADETGDSGT